MIDFLNLVLEYLKSIIFIPIVQGLFVSVVFVWLMFSFRRFFN